MTEEREEKEVSRVFLRTVDDFYKESDSIFADFDLIRERYLNGEDIMDALQEFRLKRASIFLLIDAIFHKVVDLEDRFERAVVAKEKRDKLQEFKNRFADLADEIDLFVMEEIGVGRW